MSVIIPYHNENKNIKFTLDQISNQTLKPDEIILVNSNSSDNSVNFYSQPEIKIILYPSLANSLQYALPIPSSALVIKAHNLSSF